jgi:hypothetical protein
MTPVGGYITLQQRFLFYKKEGTGQLVGDVWDGNEMHHEVAVLDAESPLSLKKFEELSRNVRRITSIDNNESSVVRFK